MSIEFTQIQGEQERHRARDLSLQRQRPPTEVPGFAPERFLGAGAYGEVWVATDTNTGRRVAIKFYAHRGGLDWSLLSREVDKLAMLFSDRYVVQLVQVGWDADPPYYVMEYLERGSLEERLRQGPLPVAEAVALAREIAVALVHVHGKGVLHCDLKPANILLDQDNKPRLADFGQSRLSHEQIPALGTLFYMAPEQADLSAAPDARWDVYALGALMYAMLTGEPPYRTPETLALINEPGPLELRLARYREQIQRAHHPAAHRKVPGVDRALAEIIDRCLATNPSHRYPNAEAVLEALDARALRRARRPLLILGALGPALLLSFASVMAYSGFHTAVEDSTRSLMVSARLGDEFAARVFADHIASRVDRRWRILKEQAADPEFQERLKAALGKPRSDPARAALQALVEAFRAEHPEVPSTAWVVFDAQGTLLARSPYDERTLDKNFAYRDFFHGQGRDLPEGAQPPPITDVHRSIVYKSQASGRPRTIAFTVPIREGRARPAGPHRPILGVLGCTIEVGAFADFRPEDLSSDFIGVLIDTRENAHGHRGTILSHPYLDRLGQQSPWSEPPELYLDPAQIRPWNPDYHDPFAALDSTYDGRWFAASDAVLVEGWHPGVRDTGWVVLVQERYDAVIGPVLDLRHKLVVRGTLTLIVIIAMLTALWGVVILILNETHRTRLTAFLRRRAGLASESLTAATIPPRPLGPNRPAGSSASTVAWPPEPPPKET
jgi:hypothetical protein